jgi:hypothetical protein
MLQTYSTSICGNRRANGHVVVERVDAEEEKWLWDKAWDPSVTFLGEPNPEGRPTAFIARLKADHITMFFLSFFSSIQKNNIVYGLTRETRVSTRFLRSK